MSSKRFEIVGGTQKIEVPKGASIFVTKVGEGHTK